MKILIVLAHPDKNSFNHAIAKRIYSVLIDNDHELTFHDLYAENFNPMLSIDEINSGIELESELEYYCEELKSAEGIIIVHPNWWGQPPAVMKGWLDRVFRPGIAYCFEEDDSGEGQPVGLLNATSAIVFNTSNTPAQRELEVFGDPLERLWKDCVFGLCGVQNFYRKMFQVVVTSSPEDREVWLDHTANIVNKYYPKNS